jgi:hypothetical protein
MRIPTMETTEHSSPASGPSLFEALLVFELFDELLELVVFDLDFLEPLAPFPPLLLLLSVLPDDEGECTRGGIGYSPLGS